MLQAEPAKVGQMISVVRTSEVFGPLISQGTNALRLVTLFVLLFAHLESAFGQPATTVFIGMERVRPTFRMDCNVDVGGDVVHFFASERSEYLGWYFNVIRQLPLSGNFGYGYVFGLGFWKTDYWLNWEIPDYFVSLDPLESSLGVGYVDGGALLYGRLGPLEIIPYLTVPVGLSRFSIDDFDEFGTAFYFGLAGGVEAHFGLAGYWLTLGFKTTKLLGPTSRYEVEEGVTLEGQFEEMPRELYFGLSFKVD